MIGVWTRVRAEARTRARSMVVLALIVGAYMLMAPVDASGGPSNRFA